MTHNVYDLTAAQSRALTQLADAMGEATTLGLFDYMTMWQGTHPDTINNFADAVYDLSETPLEEEE